MGTYLSTPVTEKETEEGSFGNIRYVASAMQGWRSDMEDAHIALPDVGGALAGVALFGVCM